MTHPPPPAGRSTDRPGWRRAADLEAGVWRSLGRWAFRRPETLPVETHAAAYAAGAAPIMWVFIAMSAVEIPILHLLLPTGWWRAGALILGAWGVLWMIGLLASLKMHPHEIGPNGVRLRFGTSIDLHIPWDAVDSVVRRHRNLQKSRSVQVEQTEAGAVLSVVVASQTTIDIMLRTPLAVPLRQCPDPVTEVRCYVDDPAAFVASARQHLER